MPVYSVTSPESGRTYQVNIDRDPTPEDVDSIWPQLDAHAAQQEANKPFFSLGDTLSGIGTALGGLPETATASYYRLTEGMKRPDQYSPEARAAFDAEQKFTQQVQQESQNRLMRGEASSAGESFRDAAPSLGFSGVTMGANILGRVVGRPAGAVVGGLVSAPTGPGALGGAGIGGAIGETATGMAASGYAAYRMAGNQFLDQAFQRIGEERAKRGEPWGEQEKEQAYNELLPLAQDTGLWEAGPEAVGNAVGLAAGKYVLGLGKKAATDLAETIWKKAGKKVAALAGGMATEVGTETITQVGSAPAQAQAEALAQGNPNWQQEQGPYAGPGGTLKALADVAPATLAQSALMLGAGGAVKAGQTLIDQRRNQGAGQPLSEAPASAPDAVPESTGDLTAEDVADLEPQPMPRREPILTGVPDRMARVRENALNTEPIMEGDVITDLRVPRSPEAIAESQRIENERLAQEAKLRAQEAKARGMPMVADSPTGSRDIVDWANENPIYLPPGFSADRKLPEYDALQRNPLPPYWRQFVASSKQGGNPDSIAQRAFDAGLIAEPTPDAYLQALQEGIAGRQQYRVQFAQRDKALAQEEKRVIDFEKSQTKLAKKDAQQVPFEDIVPGDEMTIDGEQAVVRNVEYNEDGYLTNVVIEDGKRFGLMQFDPQTRGGLLVDEFKPASKTFATAANTDRPQTITGFNEQTGSEMPVPPPTAAAGAGAGGVTRTSTTTTPPATASRTAPPASVGGGQGVASGGGAGASQTVAPAAGEVNLADVNAELQLAGGFTNLDVSGRTAGFLNTEILSEARQLIADGFTTFANWSQAMVTRFGRGIREFLQGIWQQITSPQTNAARNVRLGMPQGNAPVSIGAGGFVGGGQASNIPEGQDVTRSRFASPDEAENLYDIQATETMRAESSAWLEANGIEAALAAMEANSPPEGLRIDHLPSLGAQVITRLAKLAESGTEAQRLQADALLDRAGRAWHGKASQEAGGTLQQRAMATIELRGITPILATKQVLVERADRVVKERFEGGAEGAVQQVKDIDTKASTQAGEELAADLEAETAAKPNKGGNAIPPSERAKIAAKSGRITAKHPNLKKLLDALRMKVAPGMTWAEIFMTLPAEQKARQREIYRRLMLDERLKALNQGERLQLTNELDRAWQRERRKVFVRELEKITGLGKTKKDREKVKAALPRLLRLMNLGMLNSETFRGAIAQEYGIKQIDAATGAEMRKLGEQIQQAPEGLPRRKLEQQFMQRLQNLTGSTMAEVLESWWTASVLSGWRTQMDIALSLANGLEDVTLGSLVTALRTGNGRVAKDALFAMLSNLPTAMNEALDHLLTGNRAAMRSYDAEVKAALEDGNKLFGNVGRQLLNKGGMAKLPGAFMEFVSRLMTALDHINSTSTYEGAKAMALARHPELYEKALTISPQDRQAARTQARLELTGGEAPTTRQQRVEETARMKEILDQRVPLEFQAQAREIGLESALQGEPTGVGYAVYWLSNMINTGIRQLETTAAKSVQDNAAGRTVLHALRLSSTLVKILTGTKFVRTVGHSVTRSLSYAPGIGLVRFAEGGMKGAKADILLAKQLMGTAVGLALLMAFRDGEDDEQGIEGSHRDLTPQQRGQLLAQGRPPYSVWKRDAQGRIRSWNYQQWGIAGVLATIGAMEDQRRYNSAGKDDLAILMDGIVSGSMAWTDKTQLTGLQMLMGKDQAASSSPSSSLAGALNKWASTTVGGLVPRIFKDVDMVISPQLRDTSEWWMKWAGQVPMVRELSSGKRVNIFGEDIVLDRGPTSRITQVGTIDPALRTLGRLNERDIWLPDPTQGVRTVLLADGTRRKMTTLEKDRYQRATGAAYRKFITEQGAALLRMDAELARETISKVTERLRNQAAYQAVRR